MNIPDFSIEDAILFALEKDENITSKEDFHKLKNTILSQYKTPEGPPHIALIERYQTLIEQGSIRESARIRKVLRKRAVRSLSGVSVISLLTKFWGCPGKCIYCPSYEGLPKSYIPNEPAVQRAEMNQFDPFLQVQNRLRSLQITGNAISKCDVRIIGGTWSVYPREYQEEFIRNIYDAHSTFGSTQYTVHSAQLFGHREEGNDLVSEKQVQDCFHPSQLHYYGERVITREGQEPSKNPTFQKSKNLTEAKKRNETAVSRVIGIAIETRPDWVNEEEIIRLRRYGVTRVEIGYQTTHDEVNTLNQRGHGNVESIRATRLLKDAGFKVVAHMMPGLYGSTPQLDRSSMQEIFENPAYRPDELKIYPLVVTPHSELEGLWREGKFVPYDDATLIPLMAELQGMIPEYVRLNRMYRDIPADEILAGSKVANLRQVTELQMRKMGIKRHDISAREIRAKENLIENTILEEYFYEASGGHEWFFQMVDPIDRTLFALARLRIPSLVFSGEKHFLEVLQDAAIIREVHVFGDQIPVSSPLEKKSNIKIEASENPLVRGSMAGQHQGLGKLLMAAIEKKVKDFYPQILRMAVISGVGVRPYYEKLGYSLQDEYMVKILTKID